MKTLVALLTIIIASPLAAQTTEVGFWTLAQINDRGGRFVADDDAAADFDDGNGFGISIGRTFGRRVSAELAVFRSRSAATVHSGSAQIADLGDIKLMPVTAMVRYHVLQNRRMDVYLGGGVAYVRVDDLESADLQDVGLAPVRIDDKTAATIGAGLVFFVTPKVGLAIDARYIPFEITGYANGDDEQFSVGMNPILISTGLKVRF